MRGIQNKVTLGTILTGVLLVVTSIISSTVPVFAQRGAPAPTPTFNWVDKTDIRADNFTAGNVSGGTFDFTNQGSGTEYFATLAQSCNKPKISTDPNNPGSATLYTYETGGAINGQTPPCTESRTNITIGSTDKYTGGPSPTSTSDYHDATFAWSDANTIKVTGTVNDSFIKDSAGNFERQGQPNVQSNCRDLITPDSNDPTKGTLKIASFYRNTCSQTNQAITLNNSDIAKAAAAAATQNQVTACSLAVGQSLGGKAISWFTCPVTESINGAVGALDDLVNSNLQPDLTIFDKTGSYHAAWNSFRVIALGIVVIAALVMVISQAAGLDVLDAYTVRKLLPRLLMTAVLITFSWDLLDVIFHFVDAATTGIRSLIYAPFSHLNPIQLGGGSAFSIGLLTFGALIAMGWMALLSFGLTALISVAIAFFILVALKVLTAGLCVGSPVFLALGILDGTRKGYDFGRDALVAVAVASPTVAATIALFRVGAVIAYNRTDGNPAINQIITIILYFGGYAVIIVVLRGVGGVVTMVTSNIHDRTQGVRGGIQRYRSGAFKENMNNLTTGDRFKGNNVVARGFNKASQVVSNVPKAGLGITATSRRKHAGAIDINARAAGDEAAKSREMQQLQYDDDGIAAMFLSGGQSARRARDELTRMHTDPNGVFEQGWNEKRVNEAVAKAQLVGINRRNAMAAGVLGAQNKFRSFARGQAGIDAIDHTADLLSGGNRGLANNIREGIKYHARTHGSADFAGDNFEGSWGKASMGELNGSAKPAMDAMLRQIVHDYQNGDGQQRHRAAVRLLEAHTLLSHGTNADNQTLINAALSQIGYDFNQRNDPTMSAERYLAEHSGVAGLTGNGIRTEARTYDAQSYDPARQGQPGGPPGAP